MSIASVPAPRPARDPQDARRRFAALAARDDAWVSEAGRSRLFAVDEGRSERAVVLLHGFTNCPQQWVPFAETLHARGAAVVIPRLPGHGERDRAGTPLAEVRAPETLAVVAEAIDIACGLGERVILCGLSIGSALATRVSFERDDVARNVALVPFFGVRGAAEAIDRALAWGLRVMPDVFVPWDPKGGGGQVPPYAYPRFPTRTLGVMLGVGNDVVQLARRRAPWCETVLVLNAREPAIDNPLARRVVADFECARAGSTRTIVWDDLPANHDIVDPTNALARVDLVYPRILAEIEREI